MTKPREEFFINSAIEGLFGFLNPKKSLSTNPTSNSDAKPSSTSTSGENRTGISSDTNDFITNWSQVLGMNPKNTTTFSTDKISSPTTNPTPAPKTNLDNQCDLFGFLGTIFNLCQPEARKPSTAPRSVKSNKKPEPIERQWM